jgi:hypothetical protein
MIVTIFAINIQFSLCLDTLRRCQSAASSNQLLNSPAAFKPTTHLLTSCVVYRKVRDFLMSSQGLIKDEAISLMQIAVDVGIIQA